MKMRTKIRQNTLKSLKVDFVDNSTVDSIDSYILIDKRVIKSNSKINFNLYTNDKDSKMSLLFKRDSLIDEKCKEKLILIEKIFAKKRDRSKYEAFLEINIQNILQDDNFSIEEKTDIIYESTSDLTHSLYTNPNALKNAKRSENIVAPVLDSVLHHNHTVSSYMEIIEYDYYTHTHSLNVSIYALCLGAYLKIEEDDLKILGRAALLHDLGKSSVDIDIINKPAKLTDEEFEAIKHHPVYGYESAINIGIDDKKLLNAIRHHHEKMDGSGYPDGLKKDEISLFARILGVCDVFDALTTKRSYKDGLKSFDALTLMKKEMHNQLDTDIVNAFIKMLHS